jgi:release factor glutamine methyltransferase
VGLTTSPPEPGLVAALRAAGCVYAEDEARLLGPAARDPAELAGLVRRRVAGEPLEHLLGWAEFGGRRIAVGPGVFVPRRRTELLVERATALARGRTGLVVVDLCCGSGAVGAVLAATLDRVELHAVDIDPVAVRCARRTVAAAGGRVYRGDLDAPLPARLRGRVDLLVANAPYVPTAALGLMPPEARLHEPRVALDGGADGLDVLRRVLAVAPRWLAPRGHVLVETSERQAPRLVQAAVQCGLQPLVVRSESLDATAVVATRVLDRPHAVAAGTR